MIAQQLRQSVWRCAWFGRGLATDAGVAKRRVGRPRKTSGPAKQLGCGEASREEHKAAEQQKEQQQQLKEQLQQKERQQQDKQQKVRQQDRQDQQTQKRRPKQQKQDQQKQQKPTKQRQEQQQKQQQQQQADKAAASPATGTADFLREQLRACGLALTGTKPVLTARLMDAYEQTRHRLAGRQADGVLPMRLLSIDVGVRNLAFIDIAAAVDVGSAASWRQVVSASPMEATESSTPASTSASAPASALSSALSSAPASTTATLSPVAPERLLVNAWRRVDLFPEQDGAVGFSPADVALAVHSLIRQQWPQLTVFDAVLIERQRWQTVGRTNLPPAIMIGNTVESIISYAVLDAALCTAADARAARWRLYPVLPGRVSGYFDYAGEPGSTNNTGSTPAKKHRVKKNSAVAIVGRILESHAHSIRFGSEAVLAGFQADRKKDDYCDALMQALAYLDWQRTLAAQSLVA